MRLAVSLARVLTVIVLGWAVQACGGSVDNGSPSTPDAGNPAGGTNSNSNGGFSSSQLADCTPGFPLARAAFGNPCHFVTDDNKCFSTLDAACACACPRSGAPVVCVSGEDTWSGAEMWVSCAVQ